MSGSGRLSTACTAPSGRRPSVSPLSGEVGKSVGLKARIWSGVPFCPTSLDLWLITFSNRPAHTVVSGTGGTSRFSRIEFPSMQGSPTSQSPTDARDFAFVGVAFRTKRYAVGILISVHFAAQYPACL